ncbi:Imm1 family immunity protein [Streptomyces sp. NPDC102259]|uniref:Imm1 family immunity protein n=1 Tax=Streptomyces sp. NPDC102259 TaxID=3366148 RepID=UPI0037F28260
MGLLNDAEHYGDPGLHPRQPSGLPRPPGRPAAPARRSPRRRILPIPRSGRRRPRRGRTGSRCRSRRRGLRPYQATFATEFPEDSEIPIALVRQAVKEFLTSEGKRPTCIQWQVPEFW